MNFSDKMSAAGDKAKGHAKEAAGRVTDDESLVAEGKVDRAKGEMKEAVENVKDKVKDIFD